MKEQSLLNEIIDWKFPDKSEKGKEINQYINNLFEEVISIIDDDDDDDSDKVEPGSAARVKDDSDFPDDVVPYVVIEPKDLFLDYTCPHCHKEQKVIIEKFDRSQYKTIKCFDCSEETLLKLHFTPTIKTFLENK